MINSIKKKKEKCLSVFTKTLKKLEALQVTITERIKFNTSEIHDLHQENTALDEELSSISKTSDKIRSIIE